MNKKNLSKAFVVMLVALAGWGIHTSQKAEKMSNLILANVEALATPESPNECAQCRYIHDFLCEAYGDWGGCLGERILIYV